MCKIFSFFRFTIFVGNTTSGDFLEDFPSAKKVLHDSFVYFDQDEGER